MARGLEWLGGPRDINLFCSSWLIFMEECKKVGQVDSRTLYALEFDKELLTENFNNLNFWSCVDKHIQVCDYLLKTAVQTSVLLTIKYAICARGIYSIKYTNIHGMIMYLQDFGPFFVLWNWSAMGAIPYTLYSPWADCTLSQKAGTMQTLQ